jgi:hypothetical protein
MATYKKINLGPTKKSKPSGNVKFIKDYVFDPTNKADYAWLAAGGPIGRAVGGITKKGAKFVSKVYRNMGR